jgi:hypothetical protein
VLDVAPELYSKSATAWLDDCVGIDMSSVADGTVVEDVWEGIVDVSSVAQP